MDCEQTNPTGMPRPLEPLTGGKLAPVPWSQGDSGFGISDTDRFHAAQEHSLCLLCGEFVKEGSVIVVKAKKGRRRLFRQHDLVDAGLVLDGGPLHTRCAKITMVHCPHLKGNDDFVVMPYRV